VTAVDPNALGIQGVLARIETIRARFTPPAGAASAAPGADFASTLEQVAAPPEEGAGEQVVSIAKEYLGIPYVYGGSDPNVGLDCSGFVQLVYRRMGIELPRVTYDQVNAGVPVDRADLRPGDLVFSVGDRGRRVNGHVGIFIGDGKWIAAPKTGDVVRVQDLPAHITAIRRVLPAGRAPVSAAAGAGSTVGSAGDATFPPSLVAGVAGGTPFDALFNTAGTRHGIPPRLLAALALEESGFRPNAVSSAGATGLMQLMPSTARALGVDPRDPAQAIDGAARLLAGHLRKFGNLELALAAYGAGGGAVERAGGVPRGSEAERAIRKVRTILEERRV
jgi:hypothetical protein